MPSESEVAPFDRRRFLQLVGLGLSSAIGTPALALAQKGGGGSAPPPAAGAAAPEAAPVAPAAPASPPISDDARALAEIVRRRYGKHLSAEQIEAVTRELEQRVQGGRRLKDAKLVNADEPDFTFRLEP
ncbi:MAG: hypothetical protein ABIS67_08655 [Candidatus Eisenbacteria bacterium]